MDGRRSLQDHAGPNVHANESDTGCSSEEDNTFDDGWSCFSDASRSSSFSEPLRSNSSLLSGSTAYRYENDRRYHGYHAGKWAMPNDDKECDRYDIIHQIATILLKGELHLSPLGSNPRRILDVGTGTGVWCCEMAFKYPNARITGTDLSRIQVSPPPNCTFEIEDADSDWIFPPDNFDLIHTRQLLGGICDWARFFAQAFRSTRPNGFLELHETPITLHTENPDLCTSSLAVGHAFTLFCEATTIAGRLAHTDSFAPMMVEAGFVDVTETSYRMPIGPWPTDPREKQVGQYNWLNYLEGLEAFLMAPLTRWLGRSAEEVRALSKEASSDVLKKKLKLWHEFVVIRGRKPAPDEKA